MAHIVVSVTIDAPPETVWRYVEHIADHTQWMADAETIRFVGEQTAGVGTKFECDTKLGPLQTTDVMEITAWEPNDRMGVSHVGLVAGRGDFFLHSLLGGSTKFIWDEDLRFPWFFGGKLGEIPGALVLRWVWNRNLRKLKSIVESLDLSA